MLEVFQTENFLVEAPGRPHITRTDGGHLIIKPKVRFSERAELSPKLAIEMVRLTMLVGEAMIKGLNDRGIDVGRINYQENGNWSVFKPEGSYLHVHLYGRAKSAKINKWGDSCYFPQPSTGFYEKFEPFNAQDIAEIQKQIEILSKQEKYQFSNWGL